MICERTPPLRGRCSRVLSNSARNVRMSVFQSGAELGSLSCYLGVQRFRLKMARDRGLTSGFEVLHGRRRSNSLLGLELLRQFPGYRQRGRLQKSPAAVVLETAIEAGVRDIQQPK